MRPWFIFCGIDPMMEPAVDQQVQAPDTRSTVRVLPA